MNSPNLHQKCILIVEDEMLLAMLIEDILTDSGYAVLKAERVAEAVGLIASASIDCAIVDVNLAGEQCYPVIEALRLRAVPFIFTSGYGEAGVRPEHRGAPILSKPFTAIDLNDTLTKALASTVPPALPRP
jgi:DNA-binding response OmpR family regulator